jgi:hypothetical protein
MDLISKYLECYYIWLDFCKSEWKGSTHWLEDTVVAKFKLFDKGE